MTQDKTNKRDWFTDALAEAERTFVSGEQVDPKHGERVAVLRVFGHWPPRPQFVDKLPTRYQLMLGMVTVEVALGKEVTEFVITDELKGTARALKNLLRTRVDIVIFAEELKDKEKKEGLYPFKLIRDVDGPEQLIEAAEYAKELNGMRGEDNYPTPPIKPINRSQNDNIKAWTDQSVTRKIAVNDIDAIIHLPQRERRPSRIFLEVKRSKDARLPEWLPRTADAVNYRLMQSISINNAEITDFTCAYEEDVVGKISVFTFSQVGKTRLAGTRYEIDASDGKTAVQQLLKLLNTLIDDPASVSGTSWEFPKPFTSTTPGGAKTR